MLLFMTVQLKQIGMKWLNLFVEIDNNFKIRVLTQALIKYETQADYNWILCYILEATHIFPVLFTDEDPAMNSAIQVVYPQICYLLCIYHITENIKKKLDSNYMVKWYITLLRIFIIYEIAIAKICLNQGTIVCLQNMKFTVLILKKNCILFMNLRQDILLQRCLQQELSQYNVLNILMVFLRSI
jgi:hypothetical protein